MPQRVLELTGPSAMFFILSKNQKGWLHKISVFSELEKGTT
ncbi:hypothetical protein VCHENC02_0995 [Vibrio harveyi]|uniref:Uncharacterized protein n=1 Tax=Vibrio harveyi TaxID=669 RepID=A0A454D4E3_VIBHA|nr:hypothetical protein VCHENC02_0995 [Vibrio harveyi]